MEKNSPTSKGHCKRSRSPYMKPKALPIHQNQLALPAPPASKERPERKKRERQEQQGQRQGQQNRFSSTDGEKIRFWRTWNTTNSSSTRLKTKRPSVTIFRKDTVHQILALQDKITAVSDAAKSTFRVSRAAASTMLSQSTRQHPESLSSTHDITYTRQGSTD